MDYSNLQPEELRGLRYQWSPRKCLLCRKAYYSEHRHAVGGVVGAGSVRLRCESEFRLSVKLTVR